MLSSASISFWIWVLGGELGFEEGGTGEGKGDEGVDGEEGNEGKGEEE